MSEAAYSEGCGDCSTGPCVLNPDCLLAPNRSRSSDEHQHFSRSFHSYDCGSQIEYLRIYEDDYMEGDGDDTVSRHVPPDLPPWRGAQWEPVRWERDDRPGVEPHFIILDEMAEFTEADFERVNKFFHDQPDYYGPLFLGDRQIKRIDDRNSSMAVHPSGGKREQLPAVDGGRTGRGGLPVQSAHVVGPGFLRPAVASFTSNPRRGSIRRLQRGLKSLGRWLVTMAPNPH